MGREGAEGWLTRGDSVIELQRQCEWDGHEGAAAAALGSRASRASERLPGPRVRPKPHHKPHPHPRSPSVAPQLDYTHIQAHTQPLSPPVSSLGSNILCPALKMWRENID